MSKDEASTSASQQSPTSDISSTINDVKQRTEAALTDLQAGADAQLKFAASQAVAAGSVALGYAREGLEAANQVAAEGKVFVDQGLDQLKQAENAAIAYIKLGLDVVHSNPYVSYPVLVTGGLLLLPTTRRLLYRATLGRLRSPENIIKGSEGKVEGLKGKMDDYTQEAKKLHDRMVAAEEEYVRGRSKLKATRQELQRLASVVSKSERAAAGVLEDLRAIKKVDKATSLRAEAASQLSALKAQRTALQQYIYRIASKDI
ncbi:hypothetical protein CHLRE_10g444800v5 [Chlamydomonas reinhardtii]|uniref:Uncharacterized protein n=1 Tax=Chlamydomonas reinhardtii TaxID=3055 RepID=A8IHW6_CHLRE|nr:uncharacterized protein CHLRE_10g444800v5 [Chlamydomonas reinhardtii]PNW77622.1 hypothetical protein CHLRE_10g444800v5 [Chlamydomonas reinhardtii]|eukprot:XP_001690494.1 predicted protein [Chlamydomonas reinhardtii]